MSMMIETNNQSVLEEMSTLIKNTKYLSEIIRENKASMVKEKIFFNFEIKKMFSQLIRR